MAVRGVIERGRRSAIRLADALWPAALLLLLNLSIVWKLARIEYSAYLASNDPSFMALARGIAEHPRDLAWWPTWNCGIPFQNTYFPLLPAITALWSVLSGASIPHAFHAATAILFSFGPVFLYAMAATISGRRWASFLCSSIYSIFSCTALVSRSIRLDQLSLWNLRRLQLPVVYGEAPEMSALALLPLAILFLHLTLTRRSYWFALCAGVFSAAVILANAFGAVILGLACACWLSTINTADFRRNAAVLLEIGAAVYLWISPLVPPSVLQTIRFNSPTVDGDYRFTGRSVIGVFFLLAVIAMFWRLTLRRLPDPMRAIGLFSGAVLTIGYLGFAWHSYVLPQPHRYLIAADMSLSLLAVFTASTLLARFPIRWRRALMALVVIAGAIQFRHVVGYGQSLVQSVDIEKTAHYRIAHWLDTHLPGERIMISGSHSYLAGVLTDIPQMSGGHDPMTPNFATRIAAYAVYRGQMPSISDGEYALLWLRTMGARAITVPGPSSSEFFKPFSDPAKFEGLLPVLWRENGDTIYAVPSRTASLAHVIPTAALIEQRGPYGVATAQLRTYVDALENSSYPVADLTWQNRHTALIHALVNEGQVISVQMNYHPGWNATVDGVAQRVRSDAIGLIVVEPACGGDCEILLQYDGGGGEWVVTRAASAGITLLALAYGAWRAYRSRVKIFAAPQPGQR